jgi:hypothetical protein
MGKAVRTEGTRVLKMLVLLVVRNLACHPPLPFYTGDALVFLFDLACGNLFWFFALGSALRKLDHLVSTFIGKKS